MNAILNPATPAEERLCAGFYESRERLAKSLMGIKAVLTAESHHPFVVERNHGGRIEKGFKLKLHETDPDAPLSPIYLNLRTPDNPKQGPLTPEIVRMAATCMVYLRMAANLHFHAAVAGVPRAGDPFAEGFSQITHVQRLEMGKIEEGGKRRIGGVMNLREVPESVKHILLVDDLLTQGGSKIEAIESLRNADFTVTDLIVLVDREQGGREELAKLGVTVHAVFALSELLDLYVDSGDMTPRMRTKIAQYALENS